MATDVWYEYDGRELVNLARTARLCEVMGIDAMWVQSGRMEWLETLLTGSGPSGYADVSEAPWFDAGFPASAEFAGIVPVAVQGLDDSSAQSSPIEYVTNGGSPGRIRNTTQAITWSVRVVARTERGAEFGKRWLDRVLRGNRLQTFCSGSDLWYLRYESADAPKVHRRDVALTRGTQVTRKRTDDCSSIWSVTFTLNAADPFEYGEPLDRLADLGAAVPSGSGIVSYGTESLTYTTCPVFDYSPIYDPLYPAMVPTPTAPDFYPQGWTVEPGDAFTRHWVRLTSPEPDSLNVVPTFTVTADADARMVRIGVWSADYPNFEQCDPLFVTTLTYLPGGLEFTIDAERQAAYVWDGFSTQVRRTDSLIYGADAQPVTWSAFNDPTGLLVTLDVFDGSDSVRVAMALTDKSD